MDDTKNSLKYNTNTPVLFMVFNRPELSRQVFSQIRKAQPQRLYIAADGPRRPEGIVLEDDCLPANSFFGFCSSLRAFCL